MKRLIIILGAMILLSGCCTQVERQEEPTELRLMYEPKKFSHEGHRYICFRLSVYSAGVVHDPDCPCHKEEE